MKNIVLSIIATILIIVVLVLIHNGRKAKKLADAAVVIPIIARKIIYKINKGEIQLPAASNTINKPAENSLASTNTLVSPACFQQIVTS
jgi:hypothetical protein